MSLEGILLIDKEKGLSSFDVVKKIRRVTKVKKIGHAGTLDPLASGLLILCLGRYTKALNLLMLKDKKYQARFVLGKTTTTDDEEGKVVTSNSISHLNEQDCLRALKKFRGVVKQTPPVYSAVKINGERAYKLARQGKAFSVKEREVVFFEIGLKRFSKPFIDVFIHCSKGTYVRALARDLGMLLGVGAYAQEIRRVSCGDYLLSEALCVSSLDEKKIADHLLRGSSAFRNVEKIHVNTQEKKDLLCGRNPFLQIKCQNDVILASYYDEPIAILNNDSKTTTIARVF